MKDILPALKILARNPLGPVLIVMQIGLTIAILSSLFFFIKSIADITLKDSGYDEAYLGRVSVDLNMPVELGESKIREDMRYLNSHSSLDAAAAVNRAPFGQWIVRMPVANTAEMEGANRVVAHIQGTDERGLSVLGVTLMEGRNFHEYEVSYVQSYIAIMAAEQAIISKNLADLYFDGEYAIGKHIFWEGHAIEVIGVSENVRGTNQSVNYTVFVPNVWLNSSFHYVLRSEKGMKLGLLKDIRSELNEQDRNRVVGEGNTFEQIKKENRKGLFYSLKLMVLIFVLLLLVCCFGVLGLTAYRVMSNKRQIGIRRALGATRWQICRFFLIENTLMFAGAMLIGGALSPLLIKIFAQGGVDFLLPYYAPLITGGVMLVAMLAAAAFPAFQASRVSPASVSGSLTAKR